jgi:hypothetical protein
MPAPSGVIFAGIIGASVFSFLVPEHQTGQPVQGSGSHRLEKLYAQDGKVVATPLMDVALAEERCPDGYKVRYEATEERGNQTYLVWTIRCR